MDTQIVKTKLKAFWQMLVQWAKKAWIFSKPILIKTGQWLKRAASQIRLWVWGQDDLVVSMPAAMPERPPLKNIKVALVLSGGAVRGAAHAGVISVLQENNIPIDLIVGTSIGSVVGALYSDNPKSTEWSEQIKAIHRADLFDPNLRSTFSMFRKLSGFSYGNALKRYLKKHLTNEALEGLKIPFVAVASDVAKGTLVPLQSGPIIPAVLASCSLPLLYAPVKMYGKILMDGGIINPLPIQVARDLGAEKIIAVDLNTLSEVSDIQSNKETLERCFWLTMQSLTHNNSQDSEILIQPTFDSPAILDDSQVEAFYEAGRKAALKALPELKKLI